MPKETSIKDSYDFSEYTVLVAEDEEYNFLLFDSVLRKTKAKVVRANDGIEALNFIKENSELKNLLILMDIKMPNMDGIESFELIREINPNIPCIAVTAFAAINDKQEILAHGFSDYVSKPLKPKNLLATMYKVIEG